MSASVEKRLALFFREAADCSFDGNDFDGDSIQHVGVRLGLLIETVFDPKKHNANGVDIEAGDKWYQIAPDVLALMKGQDQ